MVLTGGCLGFQLLYEADAQYCYELTQSCTRLWEQWYIHFVFRAPNTHGQTFPFPKLFQFQSHPMSMSYGWIQVYVSIKKKQRSVMRSYQSENKDQNNSVKYCFEFILVYSGTRAGGMNTLFWLRSCIVWFSGCWLALIDQRHQSRAKRKRVEWTRSVWRWVRQASSLRRHLKFKFSFISLVFGIFFYLIDQLI